MNGKIPYLDLSLYQNLISFIFYLICYINIELHKSGGRDRKRRNIISFHGIEFRIMRLFITYLKSFLLFIPLKVKLRNKSYPNIKIRLCSFNIMPWHQYNLWTFIYYKIKKNVDTCIYIPKYLLSYQWQSFIQVSCHNRRCQNDKLDYFEWQTAYKSIFINLEDKNIDICIYILNDLLSYQW